MKTDTRPSIADLEERIAAFKEYAADVNNGRFPAASHLVPMDDAVFKEAIESIEGNANTQPKD